MRIPTYLSCVICTAVVSFFPLTLVAAEDAPTFKPTDQTCHAIDTDQLVEIMKQYGRVS